MNGNGTSTLVIKKIIFNSNIRPARERFGVGGNNDRHSGYSRLRAVRQIGRILSGCSRIIGINVRNPQWK